MWDIVQGYRTDLGQVLLEKCGGGGLLPEGSLQSTCVFIPDESHTEQGFGQHEAVEGRCWCSVPHKQGGLGYISGDGRPVLCNQTDIDPEDPMRTVFGCWWYKLWKDNVKRAIQQECTLCCVVAEIITRHGRQSSQGGNSQQGEMSYLMRRGIPFEVINMTTLLSNLKDFV